MAVIVILVSMVWIVVEEALGSEMVKENELVFILAELPEVFVKVTVLGSVRSVLDVIEETNPEVVLVVLLVKTAPVPETVVNAVVVVEVVTLADVLGLETEEEDKVVLVSIELLKVSVTDEVVKWKLVSEVKAVEEVAVVNVVVVVEGMVGELVEVVIVVVGMVDVVVVEELVEVVVVEVVVVVAVAGSVVIVVVVEVADVADVVVVGSIVVAVVSVVVTVVSVVVTGVVELVVTTKQYVVEM